MAFLIVGFFVVDYVRHNKEDWAIGGSAFPSLIDADSIPAVRLLFPNSGSFLSISIF